MNLGIIATASREQIKMFCQEHKCSEYKYETCQNTALKDSDTLQRIGRSASDVFDKISGLIEKGDQLFEENRIQNCSPEVTIDGEKYKIYKLAMRAKMLDECIFCDFTQGGPRFLTVKNLTTGKEIKIPEPTLHDIQKHGYFGRPSTEYRIDPSEFCNFFGLD